MHLPLISEMTDMVTFLDVVPATSTALPLTAAIGRWGGGIRTLSLSSSLLSAAAASAVASAVLTPTEACMVISNAAAAAMAAGSVSNDGPDGDDGSAEVAMQQKLEAL